MSLVTEDGSGKSNADSYVTLAECDAYHANLGNSEWVVDAEDVTNVADRENAIKRATAFIDARYGGRFKGVKTLSDQALLFPRVGAVDDDGYVLEGVPTAIKRAVFEASLKTFGGAELMPDLDRGGQVISETIGPISTTYASGASPRTKYEMIDGILRGCLRGGGTLRIIRA